MQVYFDNASTTPLDPQVIESMHSFMSTHWGNPSSTHAKGREARVAIENARKRIASIVGAKEKEILFTSGGTEANNAILKSIALQGKISQIISSPLEHHSVLDTLEWIDRFTEVQIQYLDVNEQGHVDLEMLASLLKSDSSSLVSLIHGNNEIGNLINLDQIGSICHNNNSLFHTDMVQTIGHYPINLNELPVDYATASAHKIHGPKGVGFIYTKNGAQSLPFIHGGKQERGLRGGTENIVGIIGMAKALELANNTLESDQKYVLSLKARMIDKLKTLIEPVKFNGSSSDLHSSLYSILNVQLPGPRDETFLFKLDLKGVALSEGSACSSGATEGSHVLRALGQPEERFNALRISFSKFNTIEEVDYTAQAILEVYKSLN